MIIRSLNECPYWNKNSKTLSVSFWFVASVISMPNFIASLVWLMLRAILGTGK